MDTIDPAQAARVWHRVQGESREGRKEQEHCRVLLEVLGKLR